MVDAEEHADAINKCRRMLAVCAFGTWRSNDDRTDLTPVEGRNVLMIGQADKRSRRYMRRLTNRLMPLVYGRKLALPPGESRYGAAQANADGDDP